jgi:hypothetical protein
MAIQYEVHMPVGNFKTNQVGTIASASLKGAQGEFKGFMILMRDGHYEIWEESNLVILPKDYENPAAADPV